MSSCLTDLKENFRFMGTGAGGQVSLLYKKKGWGAAKGLTVVREANL
jgi:hypothetical protein